MSTAKIRGVVFPPYHLVKVRITSHVKGAQCACHSRLSHGLTVSASTPAQSKETFPTCCKCCRRESSKEALSDYPCE